MVGWLLLDKDPFDLLNGLKKTLEFLSTTVIPYHVRTRFDGDGNANTSLTILKL